MVTVSRSMSVFCAKNRKWCANATRTVPLVSVAVSVTVRSGSAVTAGSTRAPVDCSLPLSLCLMPVLLLLLLLQMLPMRLLCMARLG